MTSDTAVEDEEIEEPMPPPPLKSKESLANVPATDMQVTRTGDLDILGDNNKLTPLLQQATAIHLLDPRIGQMALVF